MPETTPAEVAAKQKEYQKLTGGSLWWRLKNLADIQTAQFFIPKTKDNERKLITDAEYCEYLKGRQMVGIGVAKATAAALDKRFFHWFLEFPEVFIDGGFDCILGNPPFLGGKRISGIFGDYYLNHIKTRYAPAIGGLDLVAYFFRRIFTVIKEKGFQALISTNTIAQGDTRLGGLEVIIAQGGNINFAIRSMKWPGLAAVEVALLTVYKGLWQDKFMLGNKFVSKITSYLDDAEVTENPFPLKQNANKGFIGSVISGKGFILEPTIAQRLLQNPKNKNIIYPYLNGEDLNTNPDQSPSRWIINFFDWPEEKCRSEYHDCYDIVRRLVKPHRDDVKRKVYREKWWLYAEKAVELYRSVNFLSLKRVLAVARISKTVAFSMVPCNQVFADALVVTVFDNYTFFAILQSTINNIWAWKYCTTMKTDLNYTPSATFGTFPFPQTMTSELKLELEQAGNKYHEHRRQLMLKMQIGLTKTYNQFHNKQLSIVNDELPENEIEKKYSKVTLNLWNHLKRTENTCSFSEAVEGIVELRRLHREMDETVLKAYGWTDIDLAHDFYEVDYLPENDNIRYTISPAARREILKRLLKLNHEIHEKELQESQLLHLKKKSGKGKKGTPNDKQKTLGL